MSKPKPKNSLEGLVYSTNPSFMNQRSEEEDEQVMPGAMDLRVWLEKNHRGGKIATVIKGFGGRTQDLEDLGRTLKQKCGTGGSAKDGEIIIQGDHRDKIVSFLIQMGYKAKKAGS